MNRKLFGVGCGIVAGLIVATLTAHLWLVPWAAIMVGLFVGVETGFWIGATEQTVAVHRQCFSCFSFIKHLNWDAGVEVFVVCFVIMAVLLGCMVFIVMTVGCGWMTGMVLHEWFSDGEAPEILYGALGFLSGVVAVASLEDHELGLPFYKSDRLRPLFYKIKDYRPYYCPNINDTRPVVFFFWMPLAGSLLWPVMLLILAAIGIFYVGKLFFLGLKALCQLCVNHSTMAMAMGVVVGFFSGLLYGGLAGTNFGLLLVECLVGVVIGCGLTALLIFLGKLLVDQRVAE